MGSFLAWICFSECWIKGKLSDPDGSIVKENTLELTYPGDALSINAAQELMPVGGFTFLIYYCSTLDGHRIYKPDKKLTQTQENKIILYLAKEYGWTHQTIH